MYTQHSRSARRFGPLGTMRIVALCLAVLVALGCNKKSTSDNNRGSGVEPTESSGKESAEKGPSGKPPTPEPPPSRVVELVAGATNTCSRHVDGSLRCWGANEVGQVGDGTREERDRPVATKVAKVERVWLGNKSSTACARGGTKILCWGYNLSETPTETPEGEAFTELALGSDHLCAVTAKGVVRCWGGNSSCQTSESAGNSMDHRTVPGVPEATGIVAGAETTCAIVKDGAVWCWGRNSSGQLGRGAKSNMECAPKQVNLPAKVVQVALGNEHGCARLEGGSLACWGSNRHYQLGDGTNAEHLAPTPVKDLANVEWVGAGANNTCVLLTGGVLRCWGNLQFKTGEVRTPTAIPGLDKVAAIALGNDHACVLTLDGGVLCWGSGSAGKLGDGGSMDQEMISPHW